MQIRSWMAAAWVLAAGWAPAARVHAGEAPVENRVRLELQITGLGRGGGRVEIRPAHPGCQFPPVVRTIEAAGTGASARLDTIAIDAKSYSADRDCSFAITITEPGRPAKTYRRALRLIPREPDRPAPVQTLKCYLSSPSLATRDAPPRTRR